jgi:hypothetical protein
MKANELLLAVDEMVLMISKKMQLIILATVPSF